MERLFLCKILGQIVCVGMVLVLYGLGLDYHFTFPANEML